MGPIEIVVSALVLAVAGFTVGAIGFGFGLTTTPVLLLYLDPQTVVIVVNAVAVLAFGLMLIETREHVPYRELTPMVVAGALGAPIGVYALSTLDPSALRIGISVLVLALTALVIVKTEWRVPKPRLTGPALGFCGAAMVTGLAIGGPLFVLFLLGRGMERQGLRASMAFFFTVMYSTELIVRPGRLRLRRPGAPHLRAHAAGRRNGPRGGARLLALGTSHGTDERECLSQGGCHRHSGNGHAGAGARASYAVAGSERHYQAAEELLLTFFETPFLVRKGRNLYLRDTPSDDSGQALRLPAKGLRPSALPVFQRPAMGPHLARKSCCS